MIHLQCQHCGAKLRVPESHAGQEGRCPRCRNKLAVPSADGELHLIPAMAPPSCGDASSNMPDEQALAEKVEEARIREQQLLQSLGIEMAPQHTGERKLPWPIDILLYPASGTGLTILALLIGIPLLLRFLALVVPQPLLRLLGLPLLLVGFMAGLYVAWYMAECVYDSAKGGTRAPGGLPTGIGWGELWSRVSYLLAVYIVYVLPVVVYRMVRQETDVVFWGLAAWAVAFFPMGLLAMVMHDSVSALNPLFLLGSIFRTFFQYIGLIVLFLPFAALFWLSGRTSKDSKPTILLDVFGLFVTSYVPFILAHLLGRFYWRYHERLDWGL
jgi:hypothetical protein